MDSRDLIAALVVLDMIKWPSQTDEVGEHLRKLDRAKEAVETARALIERNVDPRWR